jgi:peptidoglycan/xylan/chitin deacetylase (PgdA/CDA1 family)
MAVMSAALKLTGTLASPGGSGGCLTILTYHRVLPERDPLLTSDQMDVECFDRQMSMVKAHFNPLPLPEAIERLGQDRLPSRAVSITFDDGYRDNHDLAWPILRRYGLTATLFVCTGFLNDGLMFNDVLTEALRRATGTELDLSWLGLGLRSISDHSARRALNGDIVTAAKYLPADQRQAVCDRLWEQAVGGAPRPSLMMTPDHVKALASAGMTIGGHTHTHPILNRVSLDSARQDIELNREILRDITGQRPSLFAYPNGKPGIDYAREHTELIREIGYSAAVSTAMGVAHKGLDLYQLPRYSPWGDPSGKFALRLMKNAWKGRHPAMV